ncbi:MAG: molybdate ABC transporter substrate-binding protein [Bdellovibrionaceae bacterium]|nr:molybdate ABC transporter substrate-binding protein [Bdellovibrionales bacterium]MCB9082854.1 molybdate ABC transporter substrate-binding protein [Pseudobdellovibrionaceae bacterium]
MNRTVLPILCLFALLTQHPAASEDLHVAVAANFSRTFKTLAQKFEQESGHKILISSGSSGNQYAQILNGAPFHVFLSADSLRPQKLEEAKKIVTGTRFTYALGILALWTSRQNLDLQEGEILKSTGLGHIAVANPRLAPYGMAAEQTLKAFGLWDEKKGQLVRGENVNQAFQYVESGNAQVGFVALSQVLSLAESKRGQYWKVPSQYYRPIEQQAVQLKDSKAAKELLAFLKSPESRKIIEASGYDIPQ